MVPAGSSNVPIDLGLVSDNGVLPGECKNGHVTCWDCMEGMRRANLPPICPSCKAPIKFPPPPPPPRTCAARVSPPFESSPKAIALLLALLGLPADTTLAELKKKTTCPEYERLVYGVYSLQMRSLGFSSPPSGYNLTLYEFITPAQVQELGLQLRAVQPQDAQVFGSASPVRPIDSEVKSLQEGKDAFTTLPKLYVWCRQGLPGMYEPMRTNQHTHPGSKGKWLELKEAERRRAEEDKKKLADDIGGIEDDVKEILARLASLENRCQTVGLNMDPIDMAISTSEHALPIFLQGLKKRVTDAAAASVAALDPDTKVCVCIDGQWTPVDQVPLDELPTGSGSHLGHSYINNMIQRAEDFEADRVRSEQRLALLEKAKKKLEGHFMNLRLPDNMLNREPLFNWLRDQFGLFVGRTVNGKPVTYEDYTVADLVAVVDAKLLRLYNLSSLGLATGRVPLPDSLRTSFEEYKKRMADKRQAKKSGQKRIVSVDEEKDVDEENREKKVKEEDVVVVDDEEMTGSSSSSSPPALE